MFEKIGSTIPSLLSFPLLRQGLIDSSLRYFFWEGLTPLFENKEFSGHLFHGML